ncbi:MAG: choice-of-anchor Q domain-containing protein [Bacteroidota bacterium]
MKQFLLTLSFAFLLFTFSSLSAASVITVTNHFNGGTGSFRAAVASASSGDTIRFASSLAGSPITISSEVSIDKPIIIAGFHGLTMEATGIFNRILSIENTAISPSLSVPFYRTQISLLTFEGANTMSVGSAVRTKCPVDFYGCTFNDNSTTLSGGAIAYVNSSSFAAGLMLVDSCFFDNNEADSRGGAIYIGNANFQVVNSTFTNNSADIGGALHQEGSPSISSSEAIFDITDSDFTSNQARLGGAIRTRENIPGGAAVQIDNCNFIQNESTENGGAVYHYNGIGRIESCYFYQNSADSSGGAIFTVDYIVVDESQLVENIALFDGGAIGGDLTFISRLRADESRFTNNSAGRNGGAIHLFFERSGLDIEECRLDSNQAVKGGAIYLERTDFSDDPFGVDFRRDTLVANVATNHGGAVYLLGDEFDALYTDFEANQAFSGGAVFLEKPAASTDPNHPTFNRSKFRRNIATAQGGALYFSGQELEFRYCQLDSNQAANGGALELQTQSSLPKANLISFDQTDFYGNIASNNGGAIRFAANYATFIDCSLDSNLATQGGGIYFQVPSQYPDSNTIRIDTTDFHANTTTSAGGAIYFAAGELSLSACQLDSNQAYLGGALAARFGTASLDTSRLSLSNCHFWGNAATTSHGGALNLTPNHLDHFHFSAQNVSFVDNSANQYGGAVYTQRFGSAVDFESEIDHCTFAQNQSNLRGGGLYLSDTDCELSFSTLSEDSSQIGGGIYLDTQMGSSSLDLNHCLIASNEASSNGQDIYRNSGTLSSSDYNLLSDIDFSGFSPSGNDQTGSGSGSGRLDPQLNALADNGGYGPSYLPLCSSPVIDAGAISTGTLLDQRGEARNARQYDIGSVELQDSEYSKSRYTVTNATDYASGSLRDLLSGACNGDTIDFATALLNDTLYLSAELNITRSLVIIGHGSGQLALDGNNSNRIFVLKSLMEVKISGLDLQNGATTANGGAISNAANLSLSDCRLIENFALQNGGAIISTGSLTLEEVSLLGNISNGNAGALFNQGGVLNATETWWKDNQTVGNGGAIWNTLSGQLNIAQTTLENNQASEGAIYNSAGGQLYLQNSTMSGNVSSFQGGAIHNVSGLVEIQFSTLTLNQSANGGSFYSTGTGATITLGNSILSGNSGISFPEGFSSTAALVGSAGGNIIGETSGFSFPGTLSDQVGTPSSPLNPLLNPLADNGGYSPTHLPLVSSPAIDNAFGSISIDQIGNSRTGLTDVGAVEVGGSPFAVEWLDFQVNWHPNQIGAALIEWTSIQEGNSDRYLIERSLDGQVFKVVGEVPALPNAGTPLHYQAIDRSVLGEEKTYYRLKEIDKDGRYQHSEIRILNAQDQNQMLSAWPNPSAQTVKIKLAKPLTQNAHYVLLDAQGREISQGDWSVSQLELSLEDFGQLSPALYHFSLYEAGKQFTLTLIKQ